MDDSIHLNVDGFSPNTQHTPATLCFLGDVPKGLHISNHQRRAEMTVLTLLQTKIVFHWSGSHLEKYYIDRSTTISYLLSNISWMSLLCRICGKIAKSVYNATSSPLYHQEYQIMKAIHYFNDLHFTWCNVLQTPFTQRVKHVMNSILKPLEFFSASFQGGRRDTGPYSLASWRPNSQMSHFQWCWVWRDVFMAEKKVYIHLAWKGTYFVYFLGRAYISYPNKM